MSLLQMTLSGGAFILFIVVIRALALHRLPKAAFLALWEMAALRLLLPFTIPLPFAIPLPFSALVPVGQLPAAGEHLVAGEVPVLELPDMGIPGTPAPAGTASCAVLPMIWLVGMALMAAYFVVFYVRTRRQFRISTPDDTPAVRRWLAGQRLRRPLEVRQSVQVSSPLTYGILRPVILLPAGMERDDEAALTYILTHEFVHIRRFDGVTKLVFAAALCVHWFNPLAWVLYVLANRDLELSCDERVMDTLGGGEKASYALTLINMAEAQSRRFSPYNHFSKLAIEERIEAIMKYKKASIISLVLALALVVGVTTAFATSAQAATENTGASVSMPTANDTMFGIVDPNAKNVSKTNEVEVQAVENGFWGKVIPESSSSTTDDAAVSPGVMGIVNEQGTKTSLAAQSTTSYSFGAGEGNTFYEKGTEIEFTIQCSYADIPLTISLVPVGSTEAVDSYEVKSSELTTIVLTVPADGDYVISVKNESLSRTQEYSHVITR